MCIYKHKTCAKIDSEKRMPVTGVSIIILNEYNQRDKYNKILCTIPVIYFIKERFGNYAGKYSLIGGRLNKGEDCYIECGLRELEEEAKIKIPISDFGKYFQDKQNNNIRYIWHNGTPIFIGIMKISRTIIRRKMLEDIKNSRLNSSYKETTDIECIRLDNYKTFEGKTLDLSSYASAVINKHDFKKYF